MIRKIYYATICNLFMFISWVLDLEDKINLYRKFLLKRMICQK